MQSCATQYTSLLPQTGLAHVLKRATHKRHCGVNVYVCGYVSPPIYSIAMRVADMLMVTMHKRQCAVYVNVHTNHCNLCGTVVALCSDAAYAKNSVLTCVLTDPVRTQQHMECIKHLRHNRTLLLPCTENDSFAGQPQRGLAQLQMHWWMKQ